jgi:hypothetical protein
MTTTFDKAHPESTTFLQLVRESAGQDGIRVSEALRAAIQAFPDATRISLKHAAIAAGINWRTARNVWDRAHRA